MELFLTAHVERELSIMGCRIRRVIEDILDMFIKLEHSLSLSHSDP